MALTKPGSHGNQMLPVPRMPKVDFLDENKTLARWTFASDVREVQDREFDHWCGWFGLDEGAKPGWCEGKAIQANYSLPVAVGGLLRWLFQIPILKGSSQRSASG